MPWTFTDCKLERAAEEYAEAMRERARRTEMLCPKCQAPMVKEYVHGTQHDYFYRFVCDTCKLEIRITPREPKRRNAP